MRSESRLLLILLLLLTISTAFAGEPAASKHGIPEIIAAFDKVEISRQEAEVCLLESFTAPEMGKPVLNAYLRWFMLTRKADELGVSVSPGEVQKKYNEFDAAPGGREAFEKDLRNSAQSWCRLEAVLKESLLLAKVARKLEDLPPETAIPQELIISIFDNLNRDYSPLINGLRRVPSAVVATVAGRDLTASDVLAFIQEYAQPARIRGPVEILIRNKQVLHEAEKLGLLPAPLDIEKVISDIREEIATQNRMRHSTVHLTLNGLLESQGRTLEEFKDSLQIRAEAARLKLLGSALSDEALAQEYENNQADYLIIKCSHILLAYDSERPYNPKDVTVEQKEAIHKISEEVEKLLQEDNDYPLVALPVFEKLVRTYTSCPSRVWKGDIGYTANTPALAPFLPPMAYNLDFLHDDANRAYSPISARFALLLPEFLPTVRALRDGEVSKPIETSYGIHIFRRDEARYPTHWQAIRGLLYDHRRQRLTLELDQKLQEKYPVKYYWEILKKEED